jgi:hemerythrin-like metal-binding protein
MEIAMNKPFLHWRDDWHLGHDFLDEQHMEMAGILNQLHHFVVHEDKQNHIGKGEICQQLAGLVTIARRHFKTEEALMRSRGYPRLAEHRCEHIFLLAELQEWVREIETGSKSFTLETLTALKHWQIDHVIYSDRLFADFLEEQLQSAQEDDLELTAGAQAGTG